MLLARGLCGDAVARTAADVNGFRFEKVQTTDDEMMLPGALKYGGLSALAALAAPAPLYLHHETSESIRPWLQATYKAAGAPDKVTRSVAQATPEKVIEWLLR